MEGFLEKDLSEFLAGMQVRSTHREDETSLTTLTGRISDPILWNERAIERLNDRSHLYQAGLADGEDLRR